MRPTSSSRSSLIEISLVARQLGTVTEKCPGAVSVTPKSSDSRIARTSPAFTGRPSLRVSQSTVRSIGGGCLRSALRSASPPITRIPGDTCSSSSHARANPRTVFTGSCDFSKRMDASVRSFKATEVFRTLTAWKHALSSTIRFVLPSIALCKPPITPATARGPSASAITRFDGVSW